jgi:hypothetical protein
MVVIVSVVPSVLGAGQETRQAVCNNQNSIMMGFGWCCRHEKRCSAIGFFASTIALIRPWIELRKVSAVSQPQSVSAFGRGTLLQKYVDLFFEGIFVYHPGVGVGDSALAIDQ